MNGVNTTENVPSHMEIIIWKTETEDNNSTARFFSDGDKCHEDYITE
jgi:hypothetical protein